MKKEIDILSKHLSKENWKDLERVSVLSKKFFITSIPFIPKNWLIRYYFVLKFKDKSAKIIKINIKKSIQK